MSFDWQQFLRLARELTGQAGPAASAEAKYRTAVSRAYYCAHWQARQLIELEGKQTISQGYTVHEQVISILDSRKTEPVCLSIAQNLKRLKAQRNDADYEDYSGKKWEAESSMAIKITDKILQDIDSIRSAI